MAGRHEPEKEQGIVRDDKGQEQPKDKERARHVSRRDTGNDPPGQKPGEEIDGAARPTRG